MFHYSNFATYVELFRCLEWVVYSRISKPFDSEVWDMDIIMYHRVYRVDGDKGLQMQIFLWITIDILFAYYWCCVSTF